MSLLGDAAIKAGEEILEKVNPFEVGREASADAANSLLLQAAEKIPGVGPVIKKGDELLTGAEEKVGEVISEDIVDPIKKRLGLGPVPKPMLSVQETTGITPAKEMSDLLASGQVEGGEQFMNFDDDVNIPIEAEAEKMTSLSKKLDKIRISPDVKKPTLKKYRYNLDEEGKLLLPKKVGVIHKILLSEILTNPTGLLTRSEQEQLLKSFSDKEIKTLISREPALSDMFNDFEANIPITRKLPKAIQRVQRDIGLAKFGDTVPLNDFYKVVRELRDSGKEISQTQIKDIYDFMENKILKGESIENISTELKNIYSSSDLERPFEISEGLKDTIIPELRGEVGMLADEEMFDEEPFVLEPIEGELRSFPETSEAAEEGNETLKELRELESGIEDEEPSSSESTSEISLLTKATDKIKEGKLEEGFADIKGSGLYQGTLSVLRSDLFKAGLAAAGVSAAGIAIYDKLLEEDTKGDLNLIPKDLETLNNTLKKFNEIYKLYQKIKVQKQKALNRVNEPGLDSTVNRIRQNDLSKLEKADRDIKANLKEMTKKVETTMTLLKDKDTRNDRDIKREKFVKKLAEENKENQDKNKTQREIRNLQRQILQPAIKDITPRIPININISNKPKNESRSDPRTYNTQM